MQKSMLETSATCERASASLAVTLPHLQPWWNGRHSGFRFQCRKA